MKTREPKYTVDQLKKQIARLQEDVEKLIDENKSLQTECYFGAMVAFLVGVALGITAGVASVWL